MQLLQTALATIYPPRCLSCGVVVESDFGLCGSCWGQTPFIGQTICDVCSVPLPGVDATGDLRCDDCLQSPKPWDRGRAALLYDGIARKLILALKHGDRQEIARPAAHWIQSASNALLETDPLIAPVPLFWLRLAKRRYNQSALLARALADLTGLEWCPDLLIRCRHTPTLDGRPRALRQDILADAITVHPRRQSLVQGRTVLLVDDVLTTGATLTACTAACRASGASHVCVSVLARAVKAPYISANETTR